MKSAIARSTACLAAVSALTAGSIVVGGELKSTTIDVADVVDVVDVVGEVGVVDDVVGLVEDDEVLPVVVGLTLVAAEVVLGLASSPELHATTRATHTARTAIKRPLAATTSPNMLRPVVHDRTPNDPPAASKR